MSRVSRVTIAWMLALAPVLALVPSVSAQTFKLLYSFTGSTDGGAPWFPPVFYGGNLFGTTYSGGGSTSAQVGTVFEFSPASNREAPYYIFAGEPNDGAYPMGGLSVDAYGDFFGTTTQGGYSLRGAIYEISGDYEFLLYNFTGKDGETPEGPLLVDQAGNLYGTTSNGGLNASGTVFKYSAGGFLVQLYNFGNAKNDGITPGPSLLLQKGILYGTTTGGGQRGWGTVFSVDIKTQAETVLYSFKGRTDGGTPVGGLATDGQGNLYGTASVGGNATGNAGNGVLFKINTKSLRYTVIHTFAGPDGSQPMGGLIRDAQGILYGTTFAGGASYVNSSSIGYGSVFELNAAGTLSTLHSFTNGSDGAYPYGGLMQDASGNSYGTATRGGAGGWGTLFEITP